jgi:serine/threonine protein phosphatase PrpC
MPQYKIAIPQSQETPIQEVRGGGFKIRYTYARSSEAQASDQIGQDYLGLYIGQARKTEHPKVTFAVCDGVGSSFMGDFAARRLGEFLCETLWGSRIHRLPSLQTFYDQLMRELDTLQPPAHAAIQNYELPADLSPLVRNALIKQRDYGSETMVVCGRLSSDCYIFACLGDARLHLLDEKGDAVYSHIPDTAQRWSTREGVRGTLSPLVLKGAELKRIQHILAYSDGLAGFLPRDLALLPDGELDAAIKALGETTASDDISLIHIHIPT